MTNKSATIRLQRCDLSPYLFHYTKGVDAFDRLKSIVKQMKLKSESGVICFTEAPLTSSVPLFNYFHQFQPTALKPHYEPLYKPYGIGISCDFLFQKGARPLIYGTCEELDLIPDELKWRSLLLDPINGDYSWLREWRIHSNEFDFSTCANEIIVIAPSTDELMEIIENLDVEIEYSYEPEIGQSLPYPVYEKSRLFKGIALDEIKENVFNSDNEITYHISKQNIGEPIE